MRDGALPWVDDSDERGTSSGGRPIRRRRFLRGGGALAGATFTAGCTGGQSLISAVRRASSQQLAATASEEPTRTSFDPDELTAEPMRTAVRTVDDTAVVYQYGQPVPSFDTWSGNSMARDHRSLDGTWRFRFDRANEGIERDWHTPDVDVSDWSAVPVPLPWDLYDTPAFGSYDGSEYGQGTAFEDGYGWYRRRFRADASWEDRIVRLHFLGVNYMAWVFVDGALVGQHEGGNSPFALDVSDAVTAGTEHVLAVRVYRPPWWDSDGADSPTDISDPSNVPAGPVDYWPYAGITRSVYVETTPTVTVSKILADAEDGMLDARVVVQNRTATRVEHQVTLDPGQDTGGTPRSKMATIGPGAVRVLSFSVPIPSADSWTPDTPRVYHARATIGGDTGRDGILEAGDSLETTYGMRTVRTEGGRLTLNGGQVFLKGVNWHEETPTNGRSLPVEAYDDVFARLRDLRVNFLRNSHYNRHPYLYEAADEAGIVVLDEASNMWLDGPAQRMQMMSYGLSRALVATMAWNQHNHPSVGLWSVHNECDPFTSAYSSWVSDMVETVSTIDRQDRPVTWASKSPFDPAFDTADVLGFNEYYGYFTGRDGDLGRVLDALHGRHPETPILITENGSWSAPELRGSPADAPSVPGSPEWQAAKFERHWEQVTAPERSSYMAGYTYWTLKNYKQRTDYNRFTYNGLSTMGLLPFDGENETAAYRAFRTADRPRFGE